MYNKLPDREPSSEETFVTVRDGRMSICVHAVFKTKGSKETSEVNTCVVLTKEQASRVAEIIGFYPKEGDLHYIDDSDLDRQDELVDVIDSL